jgi:hypothetical protein
MAVFGFDHPLKGLIARRWFQGTGVCNFGFYVLVLRGAGLCKRLRFLEMAVPGPPWTYRSVDVGLQCIKYTSCFPQDTSTQNPTDFRPSPWPFRGFGGLGIAKELQTPPSPPPPPPPRGWADGRRPRGLRSDHLQVLARGRAASEERRPARCNGAREEPSQRRGRQWEPHRRPSPPRHTYLTAPLGGR